MPRASSSRCLLKKGFADQLNRLRDHPDALAAAVKEFQAKPVGRQIEKELKQIVDVYLEREQKFASLCQFVPDVIEAEVAPLAPIYGAGYQWKKWHPQVQQQFEERVKAGGRPSRDCLLEVAREVKSLPSDKAILGVVRGNDIVPLVNDLMRMVVQWDKEKKREDEIADWERQGQRLRIYDQSSGTVTKTPASAPVPAGTQSADGGSDRDEAPTTKAPPRPTPDDEPEATCYTVKLSGDFADWLKWAPGEDEAINQDRVTDLLIDLADRIGEGAELPVHPASRFPRRPHLPSKRWLRMLEGLAGSPSPAVATSFRRAPKARATSGALQDGYSKLFTASSASRWTVPPSPTTLCCLGIGRMP